MTTIKSTDTQPKPLRSLSKRAKEALAPRRAHGVYLSAVPVTHIPSESGVMKAPTWTPKPWTPVRPGADDHKQWKSRGM